MKVISVPPQQDRSTIGSDIKLADDMNCSDVALVPDSGNGSDVKLVGRKPASV